VRRRSRIFPDQHRTKSIIWSRTSGGTHTLVRAPQDFFLKRCARPSIRPTPRLWSGSSSPGTRSVAVRLDGPVGSCQKRPRCHSRRTLFANDRIPLAAVLVYRGDLETSTLRCSAFALFLMRPLRYLNGRTLLQFQLRQDLGSRLTALFGGSGGRFPKDQRRPWFRFPYNKKQIRAKHC
jgi:hypothetical protein